MATRNRDASMTNPPESGTRIQESMMLTALRKAWECGLEIKLREKQEQTCRQIVADYLKQSREDEYIDGEMRIRAFFQTRQGPDSIDFRALSDQQIVDIARAGLLVSASKAAIAAVTRANPSLEPMMKRCLIPGGETKSLYIQRADSGR